MLSTISAATGRILISEPFMMDPNFKRSVIIITEYSVDGAMGFVLNHQGEYLLGDIIPDISYSEMLVFDGGPVATNTLHFIHRCPDKIDDGIPIAPGVFWGGNFEQVKKLVSSYQLNDNEIKFFAGYSGWTPKQLDDEILADSWIVSDNFKPEELFSNDEQNLWKDVVKALGNRYAHIANFPENPALN